MRKRNDGIRGVILSYLQKFGCLVSVKSITKLTLKGGRNYLMNIFNKCVCLLKILSMLYMYILAHAWKHTYERVPKPKFFASVSYWCPHPCAIGYICGYFHISQLLCHDTMLVCSMHFNLFIARKLIKWLRK